MAKIYFSIFIIALTVFTQYSIGAPSEKLTTEDLQNILGSIAESERYEFLRKHIDLGNRLLKGIQQNQHDKEDAELAIQIYNYLVQNHQKTNGQKKSNGNAIENYGEQICFPAPIGCFDPNDAPIRPMVNS